MNKIISLLLVGVLAAGVTTAHAESPIFKKKKKDSIVSDWIGSIYGMAI